MIYRQFHDKKLSALGMGCMRLPRLDQYEDIDIPAVKKMVAYAMEQGVNYFDTAWGYHGGNSEPAMGEVLSAYPRESFFLATKFPGFSAENFQKKEEIFEKQLARCRTEYFDFYLLHSVTDNNIDHYLDPQYGLLEYLEQQKKPQSGAILRLMQLNPHGPARRSGTRYHAFRHFLHRQC